MIYDIEFIRDASGNAAARALDVVSLVGDGLAAVVEQAQELYRKLDTVPRPDGFLIRESGGDIVHEFHELTETEPV